MKPETIAVHAGMKTDLATGAVAEPITLSTTFLRLPDGSYPAGFQYSRASNPNRKNLEDCIAELEGGTTALCFSSGNAAATAVIQSLSPGDHIIVPEDMYHGIRALLKEIFSNWKIEYSLVDFNNMDRLRDSVKKNTKLIWIETPSNPLMNVTDIAEVVSIARKYNLLTVCDNTFATPYLQSPIKLGVNIVLHSTTKYLSGHSDVLGGALVFAENNPLTEQIHTIQILSGAVPSPFDCYMTHRGIKTLAVRMKAHCSNAMEIALFLEKHPSVEKVYYPGIESHREHAVAKKQMKSFGGMLSFTLKEGEQKARNVASSTKLFTQATSLGGVESLIEHRASVEGPESKTPKNLIRASIGIEDAGDLITDLDQALSK